MLVAGLVVAGCSGSDDAVSSPTSLDEVASDPTADGELFSDGETETIDGDTAPDDASPTSVAGADEPAPDDTASSDVGEDAPDADDGDDDASEGGAESQDDGDDTAAGDGGDDTSSAAGDAGDIDVVDAADDVDPDGIDDIEDLITIDDVDDVPFCQSYAAVFEAFLGITFAGAFGAAGSDDPDALVSLAETYEVLVYPGLTDDVETIRGAAIPDLDTFLAPLLERIDAAPRLLSDAGFSDDEIERLTAEVRPTDLQAVQIDELDQRVTDAGVAMAAEFGPFIEASEALSTPPSQSDQEAFDERLGAMCPRLAETFGPS